MPELLRPTAALALLRIGPRLVASSLRLTGAVLGGIADAIDRVGDEPRLAPAPNGAQRAASADEEADELYDGAPASPAQPSAPPPVPDAGPPAPAPTPTSPATAPTSSPSELQDTGHVDEEVELVAEFADPGAQDGAGAEITVAEPWPGYDQLTADEIAERVPVEPDATLAVLELYEREHRDRRTVLGVAEAELRRRAAGAGGSAGEPEERR